MKAQRYLVYGLDVESDLALSTVPALVAGESEPAIRLQLGTADFFAQRTRDVTFVDGDWIQQIVMADGGVYIWVKDVLETIVTPDGRVATCRWCMARQVTSTSSSRPSRCGSA